MTVDVGAIVATVASPAPDPRDQLATEEERREYDALRRRHGLTPGATLAILRGRKRIRRAAEAEAQADEVAREVLGLPPRLALDEADAIVQIVRRGY